MNQANYLKLCERFPPRLLTTFEDYYAAKAIVAELDKVPPAEWDDAADTYQALLKNLIFNFVNEQFQMLRNEKRSDADILRTTLKLYPMPVDELFRNTALTPGRVEEVLNGAFLDRTEIAILHLMFGVPVNAFRFDVVHSSQKSDKLVVISMQGNRYDLMERGTCKRRSLPESWSYIPIEDDSKYVLFPKDAAFRFYVEEWVRANQDEIHAEVFGTRKNE